MKLLFLVIFICLVVLAFQFRCVPVKFWSDNIESVTRNNTLWRKVLFTGDNLQVVAMNVPTGKSLGWESHPSNEQFFRIETGVGLLEVKGEDSVNLSYGVAAVVPAGREHNVTNTGNSPLQLYTIYGPPHHPPKTVDATHDDEINREKN